MTQTIPTAAELQATIVKSDPRTRRSAIKNWDWTKVEEIAFYPSNPNMASLYPMIPCDHCGTPHRYGSVVLNTETGEEASIGAICAGKVLAFSHAESFKLLMEKRVAQFRKRERTRKAEAAYREQNPAVAKYLDDQLELDRQGKRHNSFAADVARKLRKYGELSEKQTAAIEKCLVREIEFAKKREEQAAKLATAPALTEGRVEIQGRIVSTKYQESHYGVTLKMLVELEDGNRVWGTMPAALEDAAWKIAQDQGKNEPNFREILVKFTATVERSKDDEHFGFYKRPSKLTWGTEVSA